MVCLTDSRSLRTSWFQNLRTLKPRRAPPHGGKGNEAERQWNRRGGYVNSSYPSALTTKSLPANCTSVTDERNVLSRGAIVGASGRRHVLVSSVVR